MQTYIADDLDLAKLDRWIAEGITQLENYLAKYAAFQARYGR